MLANQQFLCFYFLLIVLFLSGMVKQFFNIESNNAQRTLYCRLPLRIGPNWNIIRWMFITNLFVHLAIVTLGAVHIVPQKSIQISVSTMVRALEIVGEFCAHKMDSIWKKWFFWFYAILLGLLFCIFYEYFASQNY